jgi:hypothetical protein
MPGPVTAGRADPVHLRWGSVGNLTLSRTVRPALSGRSRPFRRYAGSGLICLLNVAGQARNRDSDNLRRPAQAGDG